MMRCVIYLRLSKEDDLNHDESNSIKNQRELIHKYIRKDADLRKMEIVELADDGYSGKNMERPGMQELLKLIRDNKVGCIIVKDMSRFSRDYLETGKYLEQIFPFMGVRFIAINDNYDSRDYTGGIGEIDVAFKGILYDFYSEDLSEKIKSSFKIKKAQGQYIAALSPYGYVKDPKDKHKLIVDPEAAVIVKRIFREYLDGTSAYGIAQRLNEEGVETRSVYFERKFGFNCQGNREKALLWTSMSVIRVLDNENYIGTFVYHKYEQTEVASKKKRVLDPEKWGRIRKHHEALITEKDFAKVQRMRQNSKKQIKSSKEHCLAGKLRCGLCGHRMRHSWSGNPKYECVHTYLNKGSSHERNSVIDADVEKMVLSVLQREIVIQGEAEKLAAEKEQVDQLKIEEAEKRMQAMQDSLEKLYADQMESFESYKAGITSRDVFMEQKASYDQMEAQLQENIEKQRKAVTDLEKKMENDRNGIRISGDQIKADRLTREMVLMLVDRITVWPGKRMEIKWNFKEK